jgi:hypothetical protein
MNCLLTDVCFNSERIVYRLECRFKSNSSRISFDGKCFPLEKPEENIKVSRSLLKLCPIIRKSMDNEDENILSESSEDEIEQISSPKSAINVVNDDYLDELAEWEPNKSSHLILENDEEEDIEENIQQMNNETTHVDPLDSSTGKNLIIVSKPER